MPDLFAFGAARGSTRVLFVGAPPDSATVSRSTPRGLLRLVVERRPDETTHQLETRARAQLAELERIAETVAQTWPRCDGERPSEAHHWIAAGFADEAVVAWLEVGVYSASAAAELRAVQIEPRDVVGEHADGVTIGCAFSRRELALAEVQRAVLGEEVA